MGSRFIFDPEDPLSIDAEIEEGYDFSEASFSVFQLLSEKIKLKTTAFYSSKTYFNTSLWDNETIGGKLGITRSSTPLSLSLEGLYIFRQYRNKNLQSHYFGPYLRFRIKGAQALFLEFRYFFRRLLYSRQGSGNSFRQVFSFYSTYTVLTGLNVHFKGRIELRTYDEPTYFRKHSFKYSIGGGFRYTFE